MRLRDKGEISVHESGIQACGAKEVRFTPSALTIHSMSFFLNIEDADKSQFF
jgi:hypothetical protein